MGTVTASFTETNAARPPPKPDDWVPGIALERIVPATRRGHGAFPRSLGKGLGPLALLAIWLLGSGQGWISDDVFPSPLTLWATLVDLVTSGELPDALLMSLQRVAVGFSFGATIGIGFALTSGLFRLGEDFVDAPMQMLRTLPWAGLVPLLVIWLGIDETPKIALVAFAVAFPLYLNTFAGIRNVDRTLIEAARTLSFGRTALVFQVILPGALPNLLVGLRYSLGSAWLALVFAETVNAQGGLGYLITYAREVYRVDIIIICLVIYALLGLFSDLVVRLLERVLLTWRQNFNGS